MRVFDKFMHYINSYAVAERYADSDNRFFANGNCSTDSNSSANFYTSTYKNPAAFTNSIAYAGCSNIADAVENFNESNPHEWIE